MIEISASRRVGAEMQNWKSGKNENRPQSLCSFYQSNQYSVEKGEQKYCQKCGYGSGAPLQIANVSGSKFSSILRFFNIYTEGARSTFCLKFSFLFTKKVMVYSTLLCVQNVAIFLQQMYFAKKLILFVINIRKRREFNSGWWLVVVDCCCWFPRLASRLPPTNQPSTNQQPTNLQ